MSELSTSVMSEDAAHRITERIRYTAMVVRDNVAKLQELVAQAQDGQAHVALGYPSWTAYIADVFSDAPLKLERQERREVVAWLSGEGMSNRAIASVANVDERTVRRDLAAPAANAAPAPRPAESELMAGAEWTPEPAPTIATGEGVIIAEQHHVDARTGEILDPPTRKITGMDGKTYTQPQPRTPQRRPLEADADDTGWALTRTIERLQKIFQDDRYNRNKNEVATKLRGHLINAVEVCQDLLDQLPEQEI